MPAKSRGAFACGAARVAAANKINATTVVRILIAHPPRTILLRLSLRARADGAGDVEDDLGGFGGFFADDEAERVEELVAIEDHDGSEAGSDASLGLEDEQAGEELVDGLGGFEVGEAGGELGGEIGGIGVVIAERGMAETQTGVSVLDGQAAIAASAEAMLAVRLERSRSLRD